MIIINITILKLIFDLIEQSSIKSGPKAHDHRLGGLKLQLVLYCV